MPFFTTAMLVAPAVATGVKTLFTAFNKPKRPQNTEMMTELQRQISNNQSDIVNKTLMNNLTRGAKSLGSRMYQQSERSLDVMRNKGELSEGQYAKGLLSAATGIQSEVGQQTENAMLTQTQSNIQMQDRINNARLQYAQMKDTAKQQYQNDKLQWTNELVGGVIDSAMAGLSTVKNLKVQGEINNVLAGRKLSDLTDDELDNLIQSIPVWNAGYGFGGAAGSAAKAAAGALTSGAQPTPEWMNYPMIEQSPAQQPSTGAAGITAPTITNTQPFTGTAGIQDIINKYYKLGNGDYNHAAMLYKRDTGMDFNELVRKRDMAKKGM